MSFAKDPQIFVVAQAVRTDARPENHDSGFLALEFAAKTPSGALQILKTEIRYFAADFLNFRACPLSGHTHCPRENRGVSRSRPLAACVMSRIPTLPAGQPKHRDPGSGTPGRACCAA